MCGKLNRLTNVCMLVWQIRSLKYKHFKASVFTGKKHEHASIETTLFIMDNMCILSSDICLVEKKVCIYTSIEEI